MNLKKCCLVILDGWGHGPDPERSAIAVADTPYVDSLYQQYPNAELVTYGAEVGLPDGQMGNSEVGHLNIGAGRVVYQDFARINKAISDGTFATNKELVSVLTMAKELNKKVHIMGLLSDGGVHSHISHLLALCDATEAHDIEDVFIHAFLDGRDTSPHGGKEYIQTLLEHIKDQKSVLSTVVGRYYAMDRDRRWERTQLAYDLLVNGVAKKRTTDILEMIAERYASGITDEFMDTIIVENGNDKVSQKIEDGDVVISFNYRTDRPRQITEVLTQKDFEEYGMKKLNLKYVTMTMYDKEYQGVDVLYTKDDLKMTLGEVLEGVGATQVRAAESEKYPHVTFFFSGGREEPFKGEHRILVPSPKVATYDLQPEMSADQLTQQLIDYVGAESPDFAIVNYANTDMVGHTGDFKAAVTAAEKVDECLSRLVPTLIENDYSVIVIADHGNADIMINADGTQHTSHTLSPVPFIVIDGQGRGAQNGKLADIATTILDIMGVDQPPEMTGDSLLTK